MSFDNALIRLDPTDFCRYRSEKLSG